MVERGGLENRCALTSTQGSNPSLSAIPVPRLEMPVEQTCDTRTQQMDRSPVPQVLEGEAARPVALSAGSQ